MRRNQSLHGPLLLGYRYVFVCIFDGQTVPSSIENFTWLHRVGSCPVAT